MSECIVRMEMPENCQGCVVEVYGCCGISNKNIMLLNGGFPDKRPSDCPIICSLPEGHGRLVDADALKQKKYHSDITRENAVAVAEIDWAETIVQAERSET